MKAFRTLMIVTVALTLGAFVASAQSLAEVAKKEKKRRETNKESAKRVITDRELTYGYGGEPSTSSTVTLPGAEGEQGEGEAGTAAEGEEGQGEEGEGQNREQWTERITAAKTKIAGIEKQLQDGDWGDGMRPGVDPMGQENLNRRQQLEQQLAVARAELASIQAEGRRAGVPPGWLR